MSHGLCTIVCSVLISRMICFRTIIFYWNSGIISMEFIRVENIKNIMFMWYLDTNGYPLSQRGLPVHNTSHHTTVFQGEDISILNTNK